MIKGNIMVNRKLLSLSIIAATAATGIFLSLGSVQAANFCNTKGYNKAECACQVALDTGSRSALRLFLKRYPRSDTACNAMASTSKPVDSNIPVRSSSPPPPPPPPPTPPPPPPPPPPHHPPHDNTGHGNGEDDGTVCHGKGCNDSSNPGKS